MIKVELVSSHSGSDPPHFRCFAIPKTMPLSDPTIMARTPDPVTGVWKKTKPLSATGILFKAPTIEYVAPLVTRTHHAEVYEIQAAPTPVRMIARTIWLRDSGGKLRLMFAIDQSSVRIEAAIRIGMESRLL